MMVVFPGQMLALLTEVIPMVGVGFTVMVLVIAEALALIQPATLVPLMV